MLDRLVSTGVLSLGALVKVLACNPRDIMGLDPITLEEGSVADLTVLDLSEQITVTPEYLQGCSKNSAFLGEILTGCATDVLLGGYWAMREGVVQE
jgi:dihydroorotase